MSTAGKVLVVLVLLLVVPWILMFSKVYDLNTNWGRRVQQLEQQYQQLSEQVAAREADLDRARHAVNLEQLSRDNAMTALRARIAAIEVRLTEQREAQERARLQNETLQTARTHAEATVAGRTQEKADTQKALDEAQALVETLRGEVQTRMDQLASMRDDFQRIVEENRQLMARQGSRSGTTSGSAGRRVRPASSPGR